MEKKANSLDTTCFEIFGVEKFVKYFTIKKASFWYCVNFGFERFAERRSKNWKTNEIAIKNGKVILVFKCPMLPNVEELSEDLIIHGDFIKDVSYSVDNIELIINRIAEAGGKILSPIEKISDENGSVKIAKIASLHGTLIHSIIQNLDYKGIFLPGFCRIENFTLAQKLGPINILSLDHVVENYDENITESVADWYSKILNLTRFWSIDDNQVYTNFSALKAQIVSNSSNNVQVTLVEPVPQNTKGRGQIREYLDFHGGPGIQHIAFKVDSIISIVAEMRNRGVQFLDIPDSYYIQLAKRLDGSPLRVKESLADIQKQQLLIDFDENGYLLQTFSKPMQDRPSLFVEIIQRNNFNGFGAGNFKALFEAVEAEQKKRGTLIE
uniref:4-hydroxyphenylpyruvate dioxygenase n=1 Tax=Panagrolaimus sp. PS1159 TaxID=55785 RepID=A0AC35FNP9_9BILA